MSTSECESGWTTYLEQSLNSWSYVGAEKHEEEEEEEGDDLSMVSDASSGPRQKFDEDEGKQYGERKKTRSKKEKRCTDVDDTASSPVFTSTSKAKSGLLKKASSVAEKCPSNKQGEVAMKKGCDFGAQGSRELGSTNVITRRLNLKY